MFNTDDKPVMNEQLVTACRTCTDHGVYSPGMYSPYIPGRAYREAYREGYPPPREAL